MIAKITRNVRSENREASIKVCRLVGSVFHLRLVKMCSVKINARSVILMLQAIFEGELLRLNGACYVMEPTNCDLRVQKRREVIS